jgi:hypothetical protein
MYSKVPSIKLTFRNIMSLKVRNDACLADDSIMACTLCLKHMDILCLQSFSNVQIENLLSEFQIEKLQYL